MKKTFKTLFTLALLAIGISASADEASGVTFDFAANPWGKPVVESETNSTADMKVESFCFGSATVGTITLNTEKHQATYFYPVIRKYYDQSAEKFGNPYLNLVKDNRITISTSEGKIASIDFNYTTTVPATKFVDGAHTATVYDDGYTGHMEQIKLTEAKESYTLILTTGATIKNMVVHLASNTTGGGGGGGDQKDDDKKDPSIVDDEVLDDNTVIDLSKRFLVQKETYGDAMGETSRDQCTGQKSYYYDKNLNLAIVANNKAEMEGLSFTTTDFQYYYYDNNNNLTSIKAYQFGTYDYGEMAFKESQAGKVSYTYNANGQRTTMTSAKDGEVQYTYNDKGQLWKEYTVKTAKTLEYTYNADGTIASVENVVTDEYAYTHPSEAYVENYTYSAAGRLIKIEKVYSRDVTYLYASIGTKKIEKTIYADTPIAKETWKYVGGYLTEHKTYTYNRDQEEIPATRFIYNYDSSKNSVTYIKETYNEAQDKWYEQPELFAEIYKDFSEVPASAYASDILSASVSTEAKDAPNTVVLEFTLPELINSDPSLDFVVYRDGQRIQTINPAQWESVPEYNLTYDEQSGHLIYKDPGVKQGTHEYFLQTVPTVGGGGPGIDPLADDPDTDSGMGVIPTDHEESFIVSNRVSVDVTGVKLPTPTNIKVIDKSTTTGGYKVTFQFEYDGDATDPALGYKKTFISINGSLFYDEELMTTSPTQTQLSEVFESGKNNTAEIIAIYELGLAKSAPFVFNPTTVKVETPTAINAINADIANGKTMLFDLQGRQVKSATRGTFIMVTNGKAQKISVN